MNMDVGSNTMGVFLDRQVRLNLAAQHTPRLCALPTVLVATRTAVLCAGTMGPHLRPAQHTYPVCTHITLHAVLILNIFCLLTPFCQDHCPGDVIDGVVCLNLASPVDSPGVFLKVHPAIL